MPYAITLMPCSNSEGPDKPNYPRPEQGFLSLLMQFTVTSICVSGNEGPDQPARMNM